jgi:hypothetical protein
MPVEETTKKLNDEPAAVADRVKILEEQQQNLKSQLDGMLEAAKKVGELMDSVAKAQAKADAQRQMEAHEPSRNSLKTVSLTTIWILLVFVVASAAAISRLGDEWKDLYFDDIRVQLTFLAFVVALAAYLAGVARETIKAYKASHRPDLLKSLRLVTIGEHSLVLLGLWLVGRMTLSPLGEHLPLLKNYPLAYTDHALVVCLGITIVWLAILHCRQWLTHA